MRLALLREGGGAVADGGEAGAFEGGQQVARDLPRGAMKIDSIHMLFVARQLGRAG